jgi:hypothetical protein
MTHSTTASSKYKSWQKSENWKMVHVPYSPALRITCELSGYLLGGIYWWSKPGVPKHLQGMLAGGLLGAGLGYGAGYLGSTLLPSSWDKTKLPRTMAVLGSMAGASPGILTGGFNLSAGKNTLDDSLINQPPALVESFQPELPTPGRAPELPATFQPNPAYNRTCRT